MRMLDSCSKSPLSGSSNVAASCCEIWCSVVFFFLGEFWFLVLARAFMTETGSGDCSGVNEGELVTGNGAMFSLSSSDSYCSGVCSTCSVSSSFSSSVNSSSVSTKISSPRMSKIKPGSTGSTMVSSFNTYKLVMEDS
ncbi:hypothetical protein OGAPHI_007266 [Ogataea philodendri]|uniref:Uncharacterized protein n=1 Tax=Ogataea philodendri TaxID=1378263 RepID=A0A9P8SZ59_9ASCO|nr:uncharacterized protein OGAPHI_007266 [Ogataea philodendri]KAH3660061.1 hypothetical protein OGAPHI_007266 [Ogataea philodendri]